MVSKSWKTSHGKCDFTFIRATKCGCWGVFLQFRYLIDSVFIDYFKRKFNIDEKGLEGTRIHQLELKLDELQYLKTKVSSLKVSSTW